MPAVTVNGVDLFYKEAGSGPSVLLIHGGGPDSGGWGEIFDDLARDHRVIAYDRRGYGRSTHPPIADYHQHGEDAAAIHDETDVRPVIGAQLQQRGAQRAPAGRRYRAKQRG